MSLGKTNNMSRGVASRFLHFIERYIQEKGCATVFVASCITIVSLKFNALDAIESYAYLAVSNLSSSWPATPEPQTDPIVVVRIDEPTFRTRYRERSPLDRCVLNRQLSAIYAAKPHLVVVDLDLSPVEWTYHEQGPEADRERTCQERLEATLTENSSIRTAVMKPFVSLDSAVADRATRWRRKMERAGISFGDAALPVSYGMTLKYFADDRTLNAEARRIATARRNTDETGAADDGVAHLHTRRKIDIHAYSAKLLPVLTSSTDTLVPETNEYTDGKLVEKLTKVLPAPAKDGSSNRVVFFGIGHGEEDTFLTPIGLLYGVEVHAAAFASRVSFDVSHVIAFCIDIVFAGCFGMIIVACWNRYFAWHCDGHPLHGELAWLWVVALLVGLTIAVGAAVLVSFQLLSRFGWWLSPIPVAAGMLIESCVAGSVESALHRLRHPPAAAPPIVSARWQTTLATLFNWAVWGIALLWALAIVMSEKH